MDNYIKNTNKVLCDTDNFLHSTQHWAKFETLAIIEGVLRSVFNMVYCLAPSKKLAKQTIKAILKTVHDQ